MKTNTLKQRILFSFFTVIFVMSFFFSLFRLYVIKINIIERAQNEIKNNLKAARSVYENELDKIRTAFSLISHVDSLQELKDKIGLDYIYQVNREDRPNLRDEIALAAFDGNAVGGTRIIEQEELRKMGRQLYEKANIEVRYTPKAKATDVKVLNRAMAIEYGWPLKDSSGQVVSVIYGGYIINNDFRLVDRIHGLVFENRLYDRKPIGTVTIFQDDVRIATNVLDKDGRRAIGTRVSETVYETVIRQGKSWLDRAFVVTDWYLTGYEPIKDIKGNIIGILYVGILEKPFSDMTRNVLLGFLGIILCVVVLAVILAVILAATISKPLTAMVDATAKIASGNLDHKVGTETSIKELNKLAEAFNEMAAKLGERDRSLKISSDKLASLNESYLDLIGFVAHELKGVLSSTILNAYSVRDGFLGLINFKQRKALDSVTRNLDYFSSTIRNFLNLSRIEKNELSVNVQEIGLKEDVFDVSFEAFSKEIGDRGLTVVNAIPSGVHMRGDLDLMQIVVNNLIVNAIKYSAKEGRIMVSLRDRGQTLEVEVYNDSVPIQKDDIDKLFRKFSRLNYTEYKRERGTGLGLFATKEIVERHGGSIRVEPKETGNSFIFTVRK